MSKLLSSAPQRSAGRFLSAALAVFALAAAAPQASAQLLASGDFYTPPAPLPPGKPGDIIRSRAVMAQLFPEANVWQIMYRSSDVQKRPAAVTGALLVPKLPPVGVRPLVVVVPGTRGLGDQCAPSKQMNPLTYSTAVDYENATYSRLLANGVAVVITDYQGQGTPGLPPYLVGKPNGYAGLDALRAATRLADAGVSSAAPMGVMGYSQGGQSSGWAGELQPSYASELDLRGVVAGGTPSDMNDLVNHLNGNPTAGAGFAIAAISGPEAPAYIFHGDIDEVVPYHLGVQLFYSWCSLGATVVFEQLIGAEHVAGSQALALGATTWMLDRLKGLPAPNGCGS
ncbi:lipase family protein [Piscinibacter sp.]|uniref:lipase family protein n=1 Tax=Piscinibacter sp. TaxID=1903157 RepID=UPI002F3EF8CB